MAEQTNISWADATLNHWIGCTKVSPACDHCYAETYGNRFGVKWGPKEARRRTVKNLAKARKIERKGILEKKRQFVFSNSLSDIFDNAVPIEWLADALEVMRATPDNVYLLLTKRPQNILKRIQQAAEASLGPYADAEGVRAFFPKNIALGCTVVSQPEAERDLPWLMIAGEMLKPLFTFVSMEPLLGPVDLTRLKHPVIDSHYDVLRGTQVGAVNVADHLDGPMLGWVITGGESGAKARPSHPGWFADLRDQCRGARVPYHHKQNGEWIAQGQKVTAMVDLTQPVPLQVRFADAHGVRFERVGTKKAGRWLDGEIHDARPKVAA